jgi:hypothetical protein
MPDSFEVDVGRRQRAHALGYIHVLARYNEPNSAGFILLTDDGKRASFRNFVFEPNEMIGKVQHMCHTIIMEDILTLRIGNSRSQSNTFIHYILVPHSGENGELHLLRYIAV